MRRTRTMLMGDLLDEFFRRPYVAAKVAEGKLPETWRAVVGDRAADQTTELRPGERIPHGRIRSSVRVAFIPIRRCRRRGERTQRAVCGWLGSTR